MRGSPRSALRSRVTLGMLGVVTTGVVLSAAGCSTAIDPVPAAVAGVPGNGSAAELRLRWAQWRSVGPHEYTYDLRRICFCTADYTTPARVRVRGGTVVAAHALTTFRPLPLELFEPIDSLFARAIRTAEDDRPVQVSYHPSLGYPTRLELGTLANDAGVRYEVTALVER